MAMQAKIKCPHCGGSIIVRQSKGMISPEKQAKIKAAADEAFKAADKAFKVMDEAMSKVFHPSMWRF